jgi:hypothetical protein
MWEKRVTCYIKDLRDIKITSVLMKTDLNRNTFLSSLLNISQYKFPVHICMKVNVENHVISLLNRTRGKQLTTEGRTVTHIH